MTHVSPPSDSLHRTARPSHTRRILAAGGLLLLLAVLLILAALYWRGADQLARHNLNIESRDQSAYLNYARNMAETDYSYVGGRNRMPVFPFLLSLLYQPHLSETQFFERAKVFHIALSLALLSLTFVLLRRAFPGYISLLLTLALAFSMFLPKAAYVQTELLFYVLNCLVFVLLLQLLHKPDWRWSMVTGGLLGLAHLTKASVLPGLVLFLGFGVLSEGLRWWQMRGHKDGSAAGQWRQSLANVGTLLLVGLVFLITIFPYIQTSKRIFGQYFYNVNSTFYIWYDSWDEVKTGTRAYGDREGWPQMPPEEIPSLQRYLQTHTPAQITQRFVTGFSGMWREARTAPYFKYLAPAAAVALIAAIAGLWRRETRPRLDTLGPILFVLAYFGAYLVLYAWYYQLVIGSDSDRFVLTLMLPFFYVTGLLLRPHLGPERLARFGPGLIISLAFLPLLWADLQTALNIDQQTAYEQAYRAAYAAERRTIIVDEPLLCLQPGFHCDYVLQNRPNPLTTVAAGLYNRFNLKPGWIASTDDLPAAITPAPNDVVLLLHQLNLTHRFTPSLLQQLYAATVPVTEHGEVLTFTPLAEPAWPAAAPASTTNARWQDGPHLTGFTVTQQDSTLHITLFWQNPPLVNDFKLFAHFRSPTGENLAQADETLLDHIPYELRAAAARHQSPFRSLTRLTLPPGLTTADGAVIIGLYHPATGDRYPLQNDGSGENGVWLIDEVGP